MMVCAERENRTTWLARKSVRRGITFSERKRETCDQTRHTWEVLDVVMLLNGQESKLPDFARGDLDSTKIKRYYSVSA
jgi:hypothetical protein